MKTRLTRRNFVGIAGTALGGAALDGAAAPVTAAPAAASGKPYRFSYALNAATIRGYKLGIVEQFELTAKAGYQAAEPWIGRVFSIL